MSVAQEIPPRTEPMKPTPPRLNGRWSGYRHLLMARMLELKREPEVVFWVFVFPLLLALGLGIAFRNKPVDAISVAIAREPGSQPSMTASFEIRHMLEYSSQHDRFKPQVVFTDEALQGFRLGKFDLVIESNATGGLTLTYLYDPARP